MKISIITVCFNSGKTIKDTFNSVLEQTYTNFEYIVIDGKSSDNTLQIIEDYKNKFKNRGIEFKYISEKDKGIYDAMNKGIKMSSGDIIGIINSDDILANCNVFKHIVDSFNEDIDAIYGDVVYMDDKFKKLMRVFISGKARKHFAWHPTHPTLYVRKKIYDKYGVYNIKYRIAADLDFMLRITNMNIKYNYIKEYLVIMRTGGKSTNGLRGYTDNMKEAALVTKNNGYKMLYWPITLIRVFKTINQYIKAKLFYKTIMKKLNVSGDET